MRGKTTFIAAAWVAALIGLPAPALAAESSEQVLSAKSALESITELGAQLGLSSDQRIPFVAARPDGVLEHVELGSSPFFGPTIFTLDGAPTNWFAMLYQDGSIRLVPRNESPLALQLAPDLYQDNGRPASLGTVPIPADYVYNPAARKPGYHDYCTASPNLYVTPELNADFRGACARHDICMEDAEIGGYGIGWCNTELLLDMRDVCSSVYVGELEKHRQGCFDTADLYFSAVTLRHVTRL